jgi:hypothetical protein
MKKILTVILLLLANALLAVSTTSAEEDFFSRFLLAARRGQTAAFVELVSPEWLAHVSLDPTNFQPALKKWAQGLVHGEIISITILADGSVRLVTLLTRKAGEDFIKQQLILDLVRDRAGQNRLIRSHPAILP